LFWELCRKSELVVDPVPPEYHATFVAPFSFFELATFLNAQVEESTEVRVHSSLFQFVLGLPLRFPVAAN
jgi:hypothetical protein